MLSHGGGWTGGTAGDLYAVAAYLAQNGLAVFSTNYTLSTQGQGTWPQPLLEVEAAASWVQAPMDMTLTYRDGDIYVQ